MSDLQTALAYIDAMHGPLLSHWQIVLEAARRYANPNIEAGAKAGYEYVHGGTRWEDAESLDRERFIGEAERIVAAALTPGDTK